MIVYRDEIEVDGEKCLAELVKFEKKDQATINQIYNVWKYSSTLNYQLGFRGTNFPESISIATHCLNGNRVMVKKIISGNVTKSFDCYNLTTKETEEIKAMSSYPDLTSFSPRDGADKFYFYDYYKDGKQDGSFDLYDLGYDLIKSFKVNKNQTFADQQAQGRRPRINIMDKIILDLKLKPIFTDSIYNYFRPTCKTIKSKGKKVKRRSQKFYAGSNKK